MWISVRRDFTQKDYCNRAEGLVQYGKFSNHKICKLLKGQAEKDFSLQGENKARKNQDSQLIKECLSLWSIPGEVLKEMGDG